MAAVVLKEHYIVINILKDVFRKTGNRSCPEKFCNNLMLKRNLSENSRFTPRELSEMKDDISQKSKLDSNKGNYLTSTQLSIAELLIYKLAAKQNYVMNEIWKHPKKKYLNLNDVVESLTFLQQMGFPNSVIADSVAVCFYSKENIKRGFKEIEKNEMELQKAGMLHGFLEHVTLNFSCGTLSRDKRLQLCLYYLELPFDFNGSGIFKCEE